MSSALEQSRRTEVPGATGPVPDPHREAPARPSAREGEPRLVMEDLMDQLLLCVRRGERE
jgi:hypothetical protein